MSVVPARFELHSIAETDPRFHALAPRERLCVIDLERVVG
jgi:hypothetical protein